MIFMTQMENIFQEINENNWVCWFRFRWRQSKFYVPLCFRRLFSTPRIDSSTPDTTGGAGFLEENFVDRDCFDGLGKVQSKTKEQYENSPA